MVVAKYISYVTGPKVDDQVERRTKCELADQSIYEFQVETLNGSQTNLAQYRNKVILLINVATYCGKLLFLSF